MAKIEEGESGELINSLTSKGALLDFYSDRAVAHASFFVASIFGMLSISSIIQRLHETLWWFSTGLFFIFSYMGYHSLSKFSYFADISEKLSTHGLKANETLVKVRWKDNKGVQRKLGDYVSKKDAKQEKILLFSRIINAFGPRVMGILYWGIIFYLGSIVYSKFLHSPGDSPFLYSPP